MSEESVMKQALSPETPVRVQRGQFRAFTLGVSVSVFAAACSFGEIDGDPGFTEDLGDATENPAQTDQDPSNVDGLPAEEPSNVTPGRGTDPEDDAAEPYDPSADPFTTDIGKQAKAILEANCGGCHAYGAAQGNFNYMLDFQQLVTSGKVVPGNKEDSQLYVRMQQQSMPPAFIRDQRPTFGQIDVIGEFIDQLDDSNVTCTADEKLPFMTNDEMIRLMEQDISRIDADDALFTRYLTIAYESNNVNACDRSIQRQRYALFKGINSVSTESTVGIPEPVPGSNELIYRIDIRDYDWDRQIDLQDNGLVLFDDGWEAIVDGGSSGAAVVGGAIVESDFVPNTNVYAVEWQGDQADDLKLAAGTRVPFMPVNAFIQFTELGDLYYALIGGRANLFVFEEEVLGINTAQEILDENVLRAGFSNSGVSKQERVLNRFDNNNAGNLAYWISFDFDGGNGGGELDVANESIYDDPLGFQFAGGEAIFNLPNGLQAYYVAAANGARLAEAPVGVVIDPAQNNGKVTNGASCHSCHNAGMITFTDTVKRYVIENRFDFDNETYDAVLAIYPDPPEFQAAMDRDSALHVRAVEEAGVPEGTPDPISRTFLDFQLGEITLDIAAAELGVTPEELEGELGGDLDPVLNTLADGGQIDRQAFTDVYLDSLCKLQAVSDNTPVGRP
jgi:serine/threonine-protein kinase